MLQIRQQEIVRAVLPSIEVSCSACRAMSPVRPNSPNCLKMTIWLDLASSSRHQDPPAARGKIQQEVAPVSWARRSPYLLRSPRRSVPKRELLIAQSHGDAARFERCTPRHWSPARRARGEPRRQSAFADHRARQMERRASRDSSRTTPTHGPGEQSRNHSRAASWSQKPAATVAPSKLR